jgi:hypothetical protein
MNKLLILLTVMCLALGACKSQAASQSSTATSQPRASVTTDTPVPTDTPEPTATPMPTATPTLEPTVTSTPDRSATRIAKTAQAADQAKALIREDLDRIGQTLPPGSLGWVQDEDVSLEMNDYNSYYYQLIDESLEAKDFILKSDITWNSTGGLMTCGFYFRSEANVEEGKQYLFSMQRLSGLPDWRIAYLQYGMYQRNITGWRAASAIDQGQGATNEVILHVVDGEYTLYINDQRIGTFYDYSVQNDEGYLAYYGDQESGESTCSFENSWIWLIEEE